MIYTATIDGSIISDVDSFHDEFEKQMGFFSGYGRNGNAWLDCMQDMYTNGTYQSLTKFNLNDEDTFVLRIYNAGRWKNKDPDTFNQFLDLCIVCNREKTHFYLDLSGVK